MSVNQLFTSKTQILDLINRAALYDDAKNLILKFNKLQQNRTPFYLTAPELEEILVWKLGKQYHRQEEIRKKNTPDNIIAITQAAFSIKHHDEEIETALRLKILCTLYGVEIPVASAILTLCFPEKYSVIDFRNWGLLYTRDKLKTNYSVKEYIGYLKIIRSLAEQYSLTPQEIDIAIWQLDQEPKVRGN